MWSKLKHWLWKRKQNKLNKEFWAKIERERAEEREHIENYMLNRNSFAHASRNAEIVTEFGDLTTQSVLRHFEKLGAKNGIRGKRTFW